jgi:sensor c-di-GMP phosphodiesterase-like protein
MSLGNTSKLMEKSRKIVKASNDNFVLSLILEIVTKIDNRMIQMEKNMGKRLDDMKTDFLAVSARVRSLEDKVTNKDQKARRETRCSTRDTTSY